MTRRGEGLEEIALIEMPLSFKNTVKDSPTEFFCFTHEISLIDDGGSIGQSIFCARIKVFVPFGEHVPTCHE